MMWKLICGRCKKEIVQVSDFGGYAIPNGVNLCKDCWPIWVEMKKRHNKEIVDFWLNKLDTRKLRLI